jgi:hypothetical protein
VRLPSTLPRFGVTPTVLPGIAFAPAAEVAYAPPFSAPTQDAMTSSEEHATLRTQRHGAYETIRDCQARFLIRRRLPACSAVPLGLTNINACPRPTS